MRLILFFACLCLATGVWSQEESTIVSNSETPSIAPPPEQLDNTKVIAIGIEDDNNDETGDSDEDREQEDDKSTRSQEQEEQKQNEEEEPKKQPQPEKSKEEKHEEPTLPPFDEYDVNIRYTNEYIVVNRGPGFTLWMNDLTTSLYVGNNNGTATLYPASFVVGIKIHKQDDYDYNCESDARKKGVPILYCRGRLEMTHAADILTVYGFDELDRAESLRVRQQQHNYAPKDQGSEVHRDSQARSVQRSLQKDSEKEFQSNGTALKPQDEPQGELKKGFQHKRGYQPETGFQRKSRWQRKDGDQSQEDSETHPASDTKGSRLQDDDQEQGFGRKRKGYQGGRRGYRGDLQGGRQGEQQGGWQGGRQGGWQGGRQGGRQRDGQEDQQEDLQRSQHGGWQKGGQGKRRYEQKYYDEQDEERQVKNRNRKGFYAHLNSRGSDGISKDAVIKTRKIGQNNVLNNLGKNVFGTSQESQGDSHTD